MYNIHIHIFQADGTIFFWIKGLHTKKVFTFSFPTKLRAMNLDKTCGVLVKGKFGESIEITPTFEFLSFRVISLDYVETKLRLETLMYIIHILVDEILNSS